MSTTPDVPQTQPADRSTKPCARKPRARTAKKTGTTLTLKDKPGKKVFVAGTFNNWCPTSLPLVEKRKGVYSLTLDLAPGIYEYKFIIDGVWTLDPDPGRDWTQNGLGTLNSLLRVG